MSRVRVHLPSGRAVVVKGALAAAVTTAASTATTTPTATAAKQKSS
jgi:hypothetical protein